MSTANPNQMPWSPWHYRLHKHLKNKPSLLPQGACLLLAISGGQDSMALLKLLLDLRRLHHWNLHIWHGDHCWHEESQLTAHELKQWCTKQDLQVHSSQASKGLTKNEASARQWRYEQLVKQANSLSSQKELTCTHVITGHTSSDRAETVLLNLARGADLAGLSSLREVRSLNEEIKLVRPILCFNRKETEQICKEMQLPVWIDPSNRNLNFSRNRIRHEVLPALEALHPGCSLRMAALAERLTHYKNDQLSLSNLALKAVKGSKGLRREALCQLSQTARATLLASWLKEIGASGISTSSLVELSKKIEPNQPPGSINLGKGLKINWTKGSVQFSEINHQSS